MSKNILLFKQIDFWVQTFLIITGSIYFIISVIIDTNTMPPRYLILYTFLFYIGLGFVQFCSMFWHQTDFQKLKFQHKFRQFYSALVYGIVVFGFLVLFLELLGSFKFIFYLSMIFISPILALFYLWITWMELQILKESSKKL